MEKIILKIVLNNEKKLLVQICKRSTINELIDSTKCIYPFYYGRFYIVTSITDHDGYFVFNNMYICDFSSDNLIFMVDGYDICYDCNKNFVNMSSDVRSCQHGDSKIDSSTLAKMYAKMDRKRREDLFVNYNEMCSIMENLSFFCRSCEVFKFNSDVDKCNNYFPNETETESSKIEKRVDKNLPNTQCSDSALVNTVKKDDNVLSVNKVFSSRSSPHKRIKKKNMFPTLNTCDDNTQRDLLHTIGNDKNSTDKTTKVPGFNFNKENKKNVEQNDKISLSVEQKDAMKDNFVTNKLNHSTLAGIDEQYSNHLPTDKNIEQKNQITSDKTANRSFLDGDKAIDEFCSEKLDTKISSNHDNQGNLKNVNSPLKNNNDTTSFKASSDNENIKDKLNSTEALKNKDANTHKFDTKPHSGKNNKNSNSSKKQKPKKAYLIPKYLKVLA